MMEASDTPLPASTGKARKIITSGRYSKSLKEILKLSAVSQGTSDVATKTSSVPDEMQEKWSLLGLLYATAMSRVGAQGAAQVFNGLHEFINVLTPEEVEAHTLSRTRGTEELAAALQDAAAIRRKTGGQDAHIGLRHALFAIMLPPDPDRFADTYELLAAAGTSPKALARIIAESCTEWAEDEEDRDVWSVLIDERLAKFQSLSFTVTQGTLVATPGADDPWAPGKVDRSGARLEAEAFASMICWRDFKPPLAVGVFGDWGSGKSFFMRLVHDAIVDRTCPGGADEPQDAGFMGHVVQIRFNAWHYAETNLWASLVDHILTELDSWAMTRQQAKTSDEVFARLDTARDWTLQAARDLIKQRKAKKDAQAELDKANANLVKKKEALADDPDAWRKGVWAEVFEATIDPALSQAAQDLGLTDEALKAPEDLRRAMAVYHPETGGAVNQDWLRFLGNRKSWGIGLVAALLLLPIVLGALMNWANLSSVGGAVAGAIAPVAAAMVAVSTGLRKAHVQLASAHQKVQQQIDDKSAKEAANRARAQAELEEAERATAEAEQNLRATEAALKEAELDYEAETGKGRILQFVRDRVTSGDYRKQLSFIAQIRRDFDELSVLMNDQPAPKESEDRRAQHAKRVEALIAEAQDQLHATEAQRLRATCAPLNADPSPVFERIVLYIDDLDRCPADQVVVVLQAIHLLLAYPLFVVFVAVDVRWLQQALEKEYEQFSDEGPVGGDHASASDYLEKIFQVPYWVRAMSADNTRDLLSDLMNVAAKPDAADARADQDATVDVTPADTPPEGDADTQTDTTTETKAEAARIDRPSPVQLQFSQEEETFAKALSMGLDGSPRRTLRFINSYRLIKASLTPAERRKLSDGGYRAVLALLAIQICTDAIGEDASNQIDGFSALAGKLRTEPDAALDWAKSIAASGVQRRMVATLEAYQQAGGSMSGMADHLAFVSRFSFSPERRRS